MAKRLPSGAHPQRLTVRSSRLGGVSGSPVIPSHNLNSLPASRVAVVRILSAAGFHCASQTSWPTWRVIGSGFLMPTNHSRADLSSEAVATNR